MECGGLAAALIVTLNFYNLGIAKLAAYPPASKQSIILTPYPRNKAAASPPHSKLAAAREVLYHLGMNDCQHNNHWPHAPVHAFVAGAAYIVTASTYRRQPLFSTDEKLDLLLQTIFAESDGWNWKLQAWAIMPNHYHLIAFAPDDASTLHRMLRRIHSKTAIHLNRWDQEPGRKVWFQYWDTCLTYERSYLARLTYVHQNPQKHGLVKDAAKYRWCSMAWFNQSAKTSFRNSVLSFKTDQVHVPDDF